MKYREVASQKWRNPASGTGTVVPDWGNADLRIGTIRAIVRQLGLDWEDFKNA
jgi:predicted RNA binding protein YcfA (HicA-like mRNA interferase family)